MNDPTNDTTIIHPMRAAPPMRQQRLKPLPFSVTQPIKLFPHQGLLESEALNHNSACTGILIEYGP
jgi:hypothetical protein